MTYGVFCFLWVWIRVILDWWFNRIFNVFNEHSVKEMNPIYFFCLNGCPGLLMCWKLIVNPIWNTIYWAIELRLLLFSAPLMICRLSKEVAASSQTSPLLKLAINHGKGTLAFTYLFFLLQQFLFILDVQCALLPFDFDYVGHHLLPNRKAILSHSDCWTANRLLLRTFSEFFPLRRWSMYYLQFTKQ